MHKFEYVGPSSLTTFAFTNGQSLERIVGTEWTSNVTNISSAFSGCRSLRTIPLLDTRKATTFLQRLLVVILYILFLVLAHRPQHQHIKCSEHVMH